MQGARHAAPAQRLQGLQSLAHGVGHLVRQAGRSDRVAGAIEQRLSLLPSMDPARRKFLDRTNYFGQQSSMDTQGRVLIHPLLRKSAAVVGDVAVLGYLTYLEVWELDKFQQRMLSDPYTEEDEAAIARLGI